MLFEQNVQQFTTVIKKLNCCLKQIEILRKKNITEMPKLRLSGQ